MITYVSSTVLNSFGILTGPTISHVRCLVTGLVQQVSLMFSLSVLRRSLFLSVVFLFVGGVAGNEIDKNVDEYSKIRMEVAGSVELVPSDEYRVLLNVTNGDPDQLDVVVRRGTLELKQRCGVFARCIRPYPKIEGIIYYRTLESLTISGAGQMTAKDLTAASLDVDINGAGDIEIGVIQSENIDIAINGAGDVSVEQGEFDNFAVTIRGAGDIEVENGTTSASSVSLIGSGVFRGTGLKSDATEVKVIGAGKAHVHASDSLEVSITGSGNVTYDGTPKVSSKIRGSGEISGI